MKGIEGGDGMEYAKVVSCVEAAIEGEQAAPWAKACGCRWNVGRSRAGDSLLWNVKRKKMERTIHYIRINRISYTGSKSSRLISNRSMPVSDAKEMILRTSAKELLKHRPSWLKDCVRISVSAQDITTGEILYGRTINIKKKEEII